jgi:pimeloyl-ACP methyl ester carboxylesterase
MESFESYKPQEKEFFDVAGGKAEVVDVSPEHMKDEVPVFIAPGWGCDAEVYKQVVEVFVKNERRALTMSHPRTGGNLQEVASLEELEKFPEEKLRKAYNILGVLEQKGLEKVDALAHSEGAMNVALAAFLHPEKFRNIVFFAPAGLIGKDNFFDLAKRFASQERGDTLADVPVSEKEIAVGKAALDSVKKYFTANPLRSLKETYEISHFQTLEMLEYLHEQGIGIVIMSGIDDPVFPTKDLQKMVDIHTIDGFMTMRGAHGAIGEQETHIEWADKMFSALKSQQEKAVDGVKPDLMEEFI